ncbi:uncharacterized protein LOC115034783 [Acyrthosiphon pisum]|uniref:Uncharacterized protein n=2 Tax=Acyrthosiphon pisum TaxID=7029 RepID=A0A8R2JWX4_ACYPI|nr:uncharacterized protein LOC115034783 [Acyrthosiphon pisum]
MKTAGKFFILQTCKIETKLVKHAKETLTLVQVEQLLDEKLKKLGDDIISNINPNHSHPPEMSSPINPERKVNGTSLKAGTSNTKPNNSHQSVNPSSAVDSDDEIKLECSEWWCPKCSQFKDLLKIIKPMNEKDESIIKKAKSRHSYWSNGGEVRCCTYDRKAPKRSYERPSCWPSVTPSYNDIDQLTDCFKSMLK